MLSAGLMAVTAQASTLNGASGNVTKAEELYRTTQYGPALALLDKRSEDPSELDLIGRIYYMQGDFHKAIDFLEKALEADPKNSKHADWLGRAWGRRAQSANPLSAAGYASKARGYFEQAVQLDPKNEDALGDLFDFYLEAPGIMGGGLDKAAKVSDQIAAINPPEGYSTKAQIAEKQKNFRAAEEALRQAIAAAPKQVSHQVAMAEFLANQGRGAESDAAFQKAERDFPDSPQVWFAHAATLVHHNRNLNDAKVLLDKYLGAPLTADDPSRHDAEKLLEKAKAGG